MIYLIMGVAGSGKSSIGLNLSKKLLVPFYDADDYHNIQDIEKMKKGLALNDSDRKSWLNLLALNMQEWNSEGDFWSWTKPEAFRLVHKDAAYESCALTD